jgi:3-oxoacyl-[acyl-carrier-protein] synthase I
MKPVFVIADNIFSPVGSTTAENFEQLKKGVSGIRLHDNTALSPEPFYASLFNESQLAATHVTTGNTCTRFEQLLIHSINEALLHTVVDVKDKKTILIISSTKGNISLLETQPFNEALQKRISLPVSAQLIADYFQFRNQPLIVSHACISGLVAMITGMRLLQSGLYDNAVVAGADTITRFVLSGFQSFHAISNEACKPFDASRNGITLGEGAATVVLSVSKPQTTPAIQICGGSVSNDANHISGPSRTGEELFQAIDAAIKEATIDKKVVDMISAHGTATVYNDEMESKAITLAGLEAVPLNSLKGFFGHTLGAAGLIESVVSVHSLMNNVMIGTPGFKEPGTTKPVNVNSGLRYGDYNCCLKTASGFGGCNAAIVLQKSN